MPTNGGIYSPRRVTPAGRLFNHIGGAQQDQWRDGDAKRPGRFEVDLQYVFRWSLHGQIGRLRTLENSVHVPGGSAKPGRGVRRITYQSSQRDPSSMRMHCGQSVLGYEIHDLFPETN